MISDAVIGIIIQMGMVVLLCIGFTFTYQIEGFPNFAHIGFTLIGTTITFTMTKLMGINPYLSWPVSMVLCGLLGVALYVLLVNPIKRRRDGNIALTLAFYALSIVIETVVGVYSYWIVISKHETTRGFVLKNFDFTISGIPGVAIMTPLASACLVVILYVFLSRTRYGLAIRAVSENEDLSAVFGINTSRVHMASWFIVGALAKGVDNPVSSRSAKMLQRLHQGGIDVYVEIVQRAVVLNNAHVDDRRFQVVIAFKRILSLQRL